MALLLATPVAGEFPAGCSLHPTNTLGMSRAYPGSWSASWPAGSRRQSSAALPATPKTAEVAARPHQPRSRAGQRAQRRREVGVDSRHEASSRARRASSATARLDRSGLCRPGLGRVSAPTMIAASAARPIAPAPCESAGWCRDGRESVLNQLAPPPLRSWVSATVPDGFQGECSSPGD